MILLAAEVNAWTLLVLFVLISLFFSFLCSIGEAVLLSVTRPYIEQLSRTGNPAGWRLQRLKQDIDRPLAAILTLNTIAHTVGATMAGTQVAIVFPGGWKMGLFRRFSPCSFSSGRKSSPRPLALFTGNRWPR